LDVVRCPLYPTPLSSTTCLSSSSVMSLRLSSFPFFFFFNDTATTEIYTLSLHDALPICLHRRRMPANGDWSLCFLRHARGPRARPEHRCGDENDLRRVRSLWLSAC